MITQSHYSGYDGLIRFFRYNHNIPGNLRFLVGASTLYITQVQIDSRYVLRNALLEDGALSKHVWVKLIAQDAMSDEQWKRWRGRPEELTSPIPDVRGIVVAIRKDWGVWEIYNWNCHGEPV